MFQCNFDSYSTGSTSHFYEEFILSLINKSMPKHNHLPGHPSLLLQILFAAYLLSCLHFRNLLPQFRIFLPVCFWKRDRLQQLWFSIWNIFFFIELKLIRQFYFHGNSGDFCFIGILHRAAAVISTDNVLFAILNVTVSNLTSRRVITLFTIPKALFIVLRTTVEDSGRLFGKVDTAAPGKAAPVMRISHFHSYLSKRTFIHGRACYIKCDQVRYDHRWYIALTFYIEIINTLTFHFYSLNAVNKFLLFFSLLIIINHMKK